MRAVHEMVSGAGRPLPAAVVAALRDAFATELAERLPRLRRVAQASTSEGDLWAQALRDVHTLGSSAYVVGENDAAQLARDAEAVLHDGGDPDRFRELVQALDAQLAEWRP